MRDWDAARAKCEAEGRCRVCGSPLRLQAAHTLGRVYDTSSVVDPDDIVPLCSYRDAGLGGCHQAYDARRLDLLPYLTHTEQAAAVRHVGIVSALRRLTANRT